MATKTRKERLSIYLAKNFLANDNVILKLENSHHPIYLDIGAEQATLYIRKEPQKPPPPWTKLFTSNEGVPPDSFGHTRAVGAAFVVCHHQQKFVLTFGTGYHLLNTESIERDFGLRVTLNSVDPDKLRSLDKASYDHNPLNSRTQSTKDVDIFDLAVDAELDILYAITGASSVPIFGAQVTGRDALTLFVETDINGILKILSQALTLYTTKLPQKFEWVDNISRIRDKDTIEVLDLLLDDELAKKSSPGVWLGEPEIVDWESQIGYSFDLRQNTPRYPVLDMQQLREYLNERSQKPQTQLLKDTWVHVNNADFQASKTWSAYRCLYAEIKEQAHHYILRNANWYKVDEDFSTKIDTYIETLDLYQHPLPDYCHDREEEYNESVSKSDPTFTLMDKKTIKVGGPYDKLEFCDLIKNGTDLIHVKYYRSSNTLSHLFAQGFVSAETFIKDADFRALLNPKLPDCIRLTDAKPRPDPSRYKIIYAVATDKKLPKELPFFSKITLKNSVKTLRALDFRVELAEIKIDPAISLKKKYKAKSPPKN